MEYPSIAEIFRMLVLTEFKPFNTERWAAFCGCKSAHPMIGYNGEFTLILDGETLNVIDADDDYGGAFYTLTEI